VGRGMTEEEIDIILSNLNLNFKKARDPKFVESVEKRNRRD